MAAAHAWLPFYYRFGLPVSVQKVPIPARLPDPQALESHFHAAAGDRVGHPSLQFRALPGSAPGTLDLALRERMFENRPGARYLPVMHAVARLRPAQASAVLSSYLNPSALFALAYSVYRAAFDRSFIPVAILIAFVLGMSYVVQRGVLAQVVRHLAAPVE